jgi:hypothetical protein
VNEFGAELYGVGKPRVAHGHDAAANPWTCLEHAGREATRFEHTHRGKARDTGTDDCYVTPCYVACRFRQQNAAPPKRSKHVRNIRPAGGIRKNSVSDICCAHLVPNREREQVDELFGSGPEQMGAHYSACGFVG